MSDERELARAIANACSGNNNDLVLSALAFVVADVLLKGAGHDVAHAFEAMNEIFVPRVDLALGCLHHAYVEKNGAPAGETLQ